MMSVSVVVRYFAAARAAVGVDEEKFEFPEPASLASILNAAVLSHGPELAQVLTRCSFLLDEIVVHSTLVLVVDGQAVDVLPPFAGG